MMKSGKGVKGCLGCDGEGFGREVSGKRWVVSLRGVEVVEEYEWWIGG